ncbi:MAG: octaprenyl diphosphate synthase [Candidatus Competibacterales bacterium]|nr:octaprenyl diphosphate synthase [Candidatus Competibacterales bacterium]
MNLEAIRSLVTDDFQAVDRLIQARLRSEVALVNQLGAYIINSGGKRLRPLVVLLAARACGLRGQDHIQAAAIIEFIHTATLLHDDVVDDSQMRRGQETANAVWGNAASVLVGDFLYSRAFQLMVELERMSVMRLMADTTNAIAEGEVMQLMYVHEPDTSEERYMAVIHHKTAVLFSAAARVGALLADRPEAEAEALADYGLQLGMAFQLVDDLLDYSSRADIGKNIGDDLAEGKPTLPLIHAMRVGTPAQQRLIRQAIENGGRDQIESVMEAIVSTGAIDYTAARARERTGRAIAALQTFPSSPYRDALIGLAEFSVSRTR